MRTFQAELLNQSIKYSTVYLTGIETILTADVNDKLSKKTVKNKQQVNHVVSFNAIKNQAIELFRYCS